MNTGWERGQVVTWVSLVVNVVLGAFKCWIGLVVNSKALLADGLHSLVDLSTDMAVLVGLRMAAKPGDHNHPYGHHRFASLGTLFIALALLFFCVAIIYHSALGLLEGRPVDPEWPALVVAGLSLVIKEGMYWWTRRVARQVHSRLLLANAWHHRTDAVSSLLVFVALVAIWLGGDSWSFIDKAMGLILGAWMGVEAIRMLLQTCNDLLDAAPGEAIIDDLREHVLAVEGAVAYHHFRVRRVGDRLEADVHLQVDPELKVGEGHRIAGEVRARILETHPEVVDVLVHVEPAQGAHLKPRGVSDQLRPGSELESTEGE